MSEDLSLFQRRDVIDEPGIVGASWWRESLANAADPLSRRRAIGVALGATSAFVGATALIVLAANSCSEDEEDAPDHSIARRRALDLQQTYGWSFGAASESVTFDGVSTQPFERASLPRLATDLRPWSKQAHSYYVATLFEALGARPTEKAEGDPEVITPLEQVLSPIYTEGMSVAYSQGRALASLFERGDALDVLVIVDLDGPAAVAFAAGACDALEPVFTFANWPHPRGVVKAHRTLAAAAYYQPLFAQNNHLNRPLLFVLDRQRLAAYSDDASQFDNRYVPLLPDGAQLRQWGVKNVLYVTESPYHAAEPWDLSDELIDYASNSVNVRFVSAEAFTPDQEAAVDRAAPTTPRTYYYGGSARTHGWFWRDYPWRPAASDANEPSMPRPGKHYQPPAYVNSGPTSGDFGSVPVAVSSRTGRVLGAVLSRSGSWHRAEGSSGG